jgi:LmbE family N-acetylglucosaminyl deacetylase
MSILIVVANPDDELFSVGATASALANQGLSGHSCILFNLI